MPRWHRIENRPPPICKTILCWREDDLYPVVAWTDGENWHLEEGGPEDGLHRQYPLMQFAPTHWAFLPPTPDEL